MKKDIQQLLQECLEGYDAGLTPEECLMAYPRERAELEPLFRQAISLRVAYAASPRAEFRFAAREKLLFAAGRDVKQALSSEPSEEFVNTTRQRLLNTAGADAQEALRDVPPPRLPFWANARRHLLEVASAAPPKPAPRVTVGMRSALSAAVVVLAVAIAGAGFFLQGSPANQPSYAAELNRIEQDLNTVEQLQASGQAVSSSLLDDLAARTSKLAEQYASTNPNEDVIEKLPDLIQRQMTVLGSEDSLNETLAVAHQRLNEADQRVAAANAESPVPEPTNTPDTSVAVAPTPEPTIEASPEPTATQEIEVPDVDIVDPSEVEPNRIVIQYDNSETALVGVRWWRVTTSTMSFVMPESWDVINLEVDENGIAVLPTDRIFIQTDVNDMMLIVSTTDGEVNTVADGQQYTLRSEDGAVLDPDDLLAITAQNDNWASLYNMLISIDLTSGTDTSATPEVTSTPDATATPEASATPEDDES